MWRAGGSPARTGRASWARIRHSNSARGAQDVRLRCERDCEVAPHAPLLRPKLRDALSASLAAVCEQSTSGLSLLTTRSRPVAPFLALVYSARAFRQWWSATDTLPQEVPISPPPSPCTDAARLFWPACLRLPRRHLGEYLRAMRR